MSKIMRVLNILLSQQKQLFAQFIKVIIQMNDHQSNEIFLCSYILVAVGPFASTKVKMLFAE